MRALKIAGLVTCCLTLSATAAAAAPQVLDDAALDGVVAGNSMLDRLRERLERGTPTPTVSFVPAGLSIELEQDDSFDRTVVEGSDVAVGPVSGNVTLTGDSEKSQLARTDPAALVRQETAGRNPFRGGAFRRP